MCSNEKAVKSQPEMESVEFGICFNVDCPSSSYVAVSLKVGSNDKNSKVSPITVPIIAM